MSLDAHPVPGTPKLHGTPLPDMRLVDVTVDIAVTDAGGQRILLRFYPYQAVKATTIDCAPLDLDPAVLGGRQVVEVRSSPWIAELRAALQGHDEGADFLDRSHHYLIPGHDRVIEVVAWEIEVLDPRSAGPTGGSREPHDPPAL